MHCRQKNLDPLFNKPKAMTSFMDYPVRELLISHGFSKSISALIQKIRMFTLKNLVPETWKFSSSHLKFSSSTIIVLFIFQFDKELERGTDAINFYILIEISF